MKLALAVSREQAPWGEESYRQLGLAWAVQTEERREAGCFPTRAGPRGQL